VIGLVWWRLCRWVADPVYVAATANVEWPFSPVYTPVEVEAAAARTNLRAGRGMLPLAADTRTLLLHARHDHRQACRATVRRGRAA
jgi:hypothetical protein